MSYHVIHTKHMKNNDMSYRTIGAIGAVFAFLGVALGAFGAHGLRGRVPAASLATFETAARYQMYHALGLILLSVAAASLAGFRVRLAGWAFTVGILLFSGSLYLLVLTGHRWLGAVTPLGGVAFLVGWGAVAWSFSRRDHEPRR